MRWQRHSFFILFFPLNYLYLCSSSAIDIDHFYFLCCLDQLCWSVSSALLLIWSSKSSCVMLFMSADLPLQSKVQTSPGVMQQESLCSSMMCTWSCDSHSYVYVWLRQCLCPLTGVLVVVSKNSSVVFSSIDSGWLYGWRIRTGCEAGSSLWSYSAESVLTCSLVSGSGMGADWLQATM